MSTTKNDTSPLVVWGSAAMEEENSGSEFGFLGRAYHVSVVASGEVAVSEQLRAGLFHVVKLIVDKNGVITEAVWSVPFNADHYAQWRATMLTLIRSHSVLSLREASSHE